MGQKRAPGFYKHKGSDNWQIDKQVSGTRICESTGTRNLAEAERILALRIEEVRQAKIFGVRPKRTFYEAATKYLRDNPYKASIRDDKLHLRQLVPWIGEIVLDKIHIGTLRSFIEHRRNVDKVKTRTVNYALGIVRRILNLATSEWIDSNGLTWLHAAPKIKLLKEVDKHSPSPLTWEQQDKFFLALPKHLAEIALFAVNSGCRDNEMRKLLWEWEVFAPELKTSVFIMPGYVEREGRWMNNTKNGEDRVIVLNQVARRIIDAQRGKHSKYVFTYKGQPIRSGLNNSGWQKTVKKTGIAVSVHALRHTFAHRLRANNVAVEDREDLLGHKSGRMTTHYSLARVENLIEAANKASIRKGCGITLTMLRNKSRKNPEVHLRVIGAS